LLKYTKQNSFKGVLNMIEKKSTPYEAIGEEKLHGLVDAFYSKVSQHPDLAPIFPTDFNDVARKQKQFLTQYLGGPQLYTNEHGHPMMRARHLPFEITPKRAQAWLDCMHSAMDELQITGPIRDEFSARLFLTAQHMINSPNDGDQE
jgi:hemoglobin